MIDYAFIGARLKEARIRKNMTQEQLAAMTDVGSTHISHIETGMTIPSTKLLVQMMNILDCDPAEVLCMEKRRARRLNLRVLRFLLFVTIEGSFFRTTDTCQSSNVSL